MSVKFNNYAVPTEGGGERPYYKWKLFVDEPSEVLETIEAVEYILHPTFPEPVQTRTEPDDAFALVRTGWGSFLAAIRIYFRDGRKEDVSYYVDLAKEPPLGSPAL
jgi:transcription initiation factor IIF auxiliary subunit